MAAIALLMIAGPLSVGSGAPICTPGTGILPASGCGANADVCGGAEGAVLYEAVESVDGWEIRSTGRFVFEDPSGAFVPANAVLENERNAVCREAKEPQCPEDSWYADYFWEVEAQNHVGEKITVDMQCGGSSVASCPSEGEPGEVCNEDGDTDDGAAVCWGLYIEVADVEEQFEFDCTDPPRPTNLPERRIVSAPEGGNIEEILRDLP